MKLHFLSLSSSLWALIGTVMVRSQDSTTGSIDSATDTQATPTTTPPATRTVDPNIVQCYFTEDLPTLTITYPLEENTSNLPALPSGVPCYSILSDGILESTPFTTIGVPDFTDGVTDIPRSSSDSPTSTPTEGGALGSSGESHTGTKVVLPAVLCSIAAATILVVGLLWFRKKRGPNRRRESSQRAWVHRPGGWVQDGLSGDGKEGAQDIALKERPHISGV